MKTKKEIVENWLPRYTGTSLEDYGQYIILVNFSKYVKMFAEWHNVEIKGQDRSMISATAENITICLLYTSPSPRDATLSRMPSSA